MQTKKGMLAETEETHDAMLTLQEMGRSIAFSYATVMAEPLPKEMASLLLRLALAEAMRGAAEEEMRENGAEDLSEASGCRLAEYSA